MNIAAPAPAAVQTDWPNAIYRTLKAHNVAQISYVPDAGHSRLIELSHADPAIATTVLTTEEEGVAMANDTDYGLAATLVTGSQERAERVSSQLRAGTVWINCFFVRDLSAPFGGSGRSGIGREGGIWSFDFYCDVKNSVFAPKGWN